MSASTTSLKFRYALDNHSEVYGKAVYYDVLSRTPGGLTVAQYNADPSRTPVRPTSGAATARASTWAT
jgi:Fe(3+) dicitrate transport protein